jgi:putative membrane protein
VVFFLLVTTGLAGTALAAVLTFAPAPIYPPAAFGAPGDGAPADGAPADGAPPWPTGSSGVDPLTDQQLAGLVMWVPMDVVVLGIAGTVLVRWLTKVDRRLPAERDRLPVASSEGPSR